MTKLYSTGYTGTIGKYLSKSTYPIMLDLSSDQRNFHGIQFETDSNLIHLAGIVGESQVLRNVRYAHSINIDGTTYLAKEFFKKSEGIFYYISTSHVYAPSIDLITESNPTLPRNIYAEQKFEAESLLRSIFNLNPNRLCIIRVFSVLDWDSAPFTLGGGIRKLSDINSDFILSNASDIRDFLTPKDIANALFEIASAGTHFRIVNLCSGTGTSVGDAAKRMLFEGGFNVAESRFSWIQSSNPFVVGDNSLLMSHHPNLKLFWQPSTLKLG